MAVYRVKAPDGTVVRVQAPEGTSEAEIMKRVQTMYKPAPKRAGIMGGVDAFLHGATAGVLSNFDDEVTAGLNLIAPVEGNSRGFWEGPHVEDLVRGNVDPNPITRNYNANLRAQRATNTFDENWHPKVRAAGRGVGAVAQAILALEYGPRIPLPAPVAAILKTPLMKNAIVRSALAGGAGGAASGAGEGTTAGSRAQSAAMGGVTGAVLGTGFGVLATGAGPVIQRYWNAFRGKGTEQEALRQIAAALKRDGYDVDSPAGRAALEAELSKFTKKPVSLADVGRASRQRAGVGLRTPSEAQGPGQDVVIRRAQTQGDRLSGDIRATVAPRTDVHALDEALIAQREAEALPLKQQALHVQNPNIPAPSSGELPAVTQTLPVVVDDPVLQSLANTPLAQGAWAEARKLALAERETLLAQGKSVEHLPTLDPNEPLDFKSLDFMKRYLDGAVDRAFRANDGANAVELKRLRDAMVERMRATNSTYGDYLDSYAGTSELRDSLEAGRGGPGVPGFDRLDPEAIALGQANRSQAGQEFYRVGVARRLEDIVNGVNDTGTAAPANRILNSPTARARLEATGVGPKNMSQLEEAVGQERQMGLLSRELGGSETVSRSNAQAAADSGIGIETPLMARSPISWLALGGRRALGMVNLARNEKVNEALLPRMLDQDPASIRRTIEELEKSGRIMEAAQLRRKSQAIIGSGVGGIYIGGPVAVHGDDQ